MCTNEEYICYHAYIAVSVCCFGIVTNIINIVIWSRQRHPSAINLILKVLSVADLFAVSSYFVFAVYIFLMTGPTSAYHHSRLGAYVVLVSYHIFIVSLTWSTWTVIVLSSFRFINVCGRITCTLKSAKLAMCIEFIVVIVVSGLNYLYYTVTECEDIDPQYEMTYNCSGYWLEKTPIVKHLRFYQETFFWIFGVFRGLIPVSIFCILCVGMIISLLRLARQFARHDDYFRKTLGLFVLLMLFTGALIPIAIDSFRLAQNDQKHREFFFFMTDIPNINVVALLQILNATLSIFVYTLMSRVFRRELVHFTQSVFHCRQEENIYNDELIRLLPQAQAPRDEDVLFQ